MYLFVVKFVISISGARGSQADIELSIAAIALLILFVKTEKYKEFLEDEEEDDKMQKPDGEKNRIINLLYFCR